LLPQSMKSETTEMRLKHVLQKEQRHPLK